MEIIGLLELRVDHVLAIFTDKSPLIRSVEASSATQFYCSEPLYESPDIVKLRSNNHLPMAIDEAIFPLLRDCRQPFLKVTSGIIEWLDCQHTIFINVSILAVDHYGIESTIFQLVIRLRTVEPPVSCSRSNYDNY